MVKEKSPPLLDVGTMELIIKGGVQVLTSGIKQFTPNGRLVFVSCSDTCDAAVLQAWFSKTAASTSLTLLSSPLASRHVLFPLLSQHMLFYSQHLGSFMGFLEEPLVAKLKEHVRTWQNTVAESYLGGSGLPSRVHPKLFFVGFNDWIGASTSSMCVVDRVIAGLLHECGREASLLADRLAASA